MKPFFTLHPGESSHILWCPKTSQSHGYVTLSSSLFSVECKGHVLLLPKKALLRVREKTLFTTRRCAGLCGA